MGRIFYVSGPIHEDHRAFPYAIALRESSTVE